MAELYDVLMAYPKPTQDSPALLTPLSILYPGVLVESQGKSAAYFDERFDSLEMFDELVMRSAEVAVSAFTGFQAGQAARMLKRAKRLNPSIIGSVGGHHPRTVGEQEVLAEPFVDKVYTERIYGEHLFPFNERTKIHFQRTEVQYFTSSGCPFSCAFCALKSPWNPKDIKVLDRELRQIHDAVGFTEISFSDPNIAYGAWTSSDGKIERMNRVQRIRDIGKIMRNLGVKWDGNIRAPYLTSEMVDALAESNCYSIEIGCESGNEHFLKKVIRKGHGVDAIKEAAQNICGSGISIMYSFITNMPRETREMRNDTFDLIDWIVDVDPNARVSMYNYAPYPGNPMYVDAVNGADGYPKFVPPTTMEGWGAMRLMATPIYWIVGLNFRMDNTRKNFPGDDWKLIEPYVDLAKEKWAKRDLSEFPCEEVEQLIFNQLKKRAVNF